MNVADGTQWKIIVDDEIDSNEVDAATHEVRTNQDPNGARTELAHSILPL